MIAILAQAGLPVPAASARIGVVDRLFSRVGAADDLARGRSTFMVEMTETAAILHQAGPRSLVVVDEIGRGTGTLDGLAIAWAVLEALHNLVRCRAIFATHFHELAQLTARTAAARAAYDAGQGMEAGRGVSARGRPWRRRPKLGRACGAARGVPRLVVKRAGVLLAALEKRAGRLTEAAALPLFAARARASRSRRADAAATTRCARALAASIPDRLAPRAALGRTLSAEGADCCRAGRSVANIALMSPVPPSPPSRARPPPCCGRPWPTPNPAAGRCRATRRSACFAAISPACRPMSARRSRRATSPG